MADRYRVDFTMQRGHEMLLTREPELSREDMDEIDLAMLQHHRSPGLLAADWLEVDGKLTFRYMVAGRKMLAQQLQLQPLGMNDFYALILGVVDILDGCKPNLLREEAVLLNEQYMFVGNEWSDIQAAYLPRKTAEDGMSAREALQLLAVRWVSRVSHVDGAGLRHVLQLLENGLSWQELRVQLLRLIAGGFGGDLPKPPGKPGAKAQAAAPIPVPIPAPASALAGEAFRLTDDSRLETAAASAVQPVGRWMFGGLKEIRTVEPFEDPDDSGWLAEPDPMPLSGGTADNPNGSRLRWLTGAAAIVITAGIWRAVYLAQPSGRNLLLAAGLTALTAFVLLLVWRKLQNPQTAVPAARTSDNEADYSSDPHVYSGTGFGRRTGGGGYGAQDPSPPLSIPAAQTGRDDTVMLVPLQQTAAQQHAGIHLEREWRGRSDRIELREGTRVIGRSSEASDVLDEADGLSRAHLELVRVSADVQVRDLGSRNGSLLNGEAMVPYKYYAFNPGDAVQLAGTVGPLYRRC